MACKISPKTSILMDLANHRNMGLSDKSYFIMWKGDKIIPPPLIMDISLTIIYINAFDSCIVGT